MSYEDCVWLQDSNEVFFFFSSRRRHTRSLRDWSSDVCYSDLKAFCAGADLAWMRAMADYTWEQNRADAQGLADMLYAIWSCPVPVVGRIHGDAYAGGVGLAAVCDVLVAAEGVNFCLSEAKLG